MLFKGLLLNCCRAFPVNMVVLVAEGRAEAHAGACSHSWCPATTPGGAVQKGSQGLQRLEVARRVRGSGPRGYYPQHSQEPPARRATGRVRGPARRGHGTQA